MQHTLAGRFSAVDGSFLPGPCNRESSTARVPHPGMVVQTKSSAVAMSLSIGTSIRAPSRDVAVTRAPPVSTSFGSFTASRGGLFVVTLTGLIDPVTAPELLLLVEQFRDGRSAVAIATCRRSPSSAGRGSTSVATTTDRPRARRFRVPPPGITRLHAHTFNSRIRPNFRSGALSRRPARTRVRAPAVTHSECGFRGADKARRSRNACTVGGCGSRCPRPLRV